MDGLDVDWTDSHLVWEIFCSAWEFVGVGSADCCYMATVDVSFQGKIWGGLGLWKKLWLVIGWIVFRNHVLSRCRRGSIPVYERGWVNDVLVDMCRLYGVIEKWGCTTGGVGTRIWKSSVVGRIHDCTVEVIAMKEGRWENFRFREQ